MFACGSYNKCLQYLFEGKVTKKECIRKSLCFQEAFRRFEIISGTIYPVLYCLINIESHAVSLSRTEFIGTHFYIMADSTIY